jgi:hypothetical protein
MEKVRANALKRSKALQGQVLVSSFSPSLSSAGFFLADLSECLTVLPRSANSLDFNSLKKLTDASDGNLGAHIDTGTRGICAR